MLLKLQSIPLSRPRLGFVAQRRLQVRSNKFQNLENFFLKLIEDFFSQFIYLIFNPYGNVGEERSVCNTTLDRSFLARGLTGSCLRS
jgi:hypothetical protein